MLDLVRVIRVVVDRILRGERGGGRKEGIRWEGKGNYSLFLFNSSFVSINRGWEVAVSEG